MSDVGNTVNENQEENQQPEGLRALVVDDVHLLRIVLKDMLVKFGEVHPKNVFEAGGGSIAVREYKRISPDIVFLDVLMPDKSGLDVVKEIMEYDSNAYIIMYSSAAERQVVHDCLKLGATDYVLKPLDPKRLKFSLYKYENRNDPEVLAMKAEIFLESADSMNDSPQGDPEQLRRVRT